MSIQSEHGQMNPIEFAKHLTNHLMGSENNWQTHPAASTRLLALREDQQQISLDLTPPTFQPYTADAHTYFDSVTTFDELLSAYHKAKVAKPLEPTNTVLLYAGIYLAQSFEQARKEYTNEDATLIAQWVKTLDIYTAIKSVECLLDNHENLTIFYLAKEQNWTLLFDHLAIRCSTQSGSDAKAIAHILTEFHGYEHPPVDEERHYIFDDGWSAFPLYKTLTNGQRLRLFVDQSDEGFPEQIIQHWNKVYGFTAHHLAIRATRQEQGKTVAVPLEEMIDALENRGVNSMEPTGFYTHGLLEQVFLKPHLNTQVPEKIKADLNAINNTLGTTIANGKLIELVSRRELQSDLAKQTFALNGLNYSSEDNLHSAPIYDYFLPAQAAHVIQTSVQTEPVEQARPG